jgi:hypothetical protein
MRFVGTEHSMNVFFFIVSYLSHFWWYKCIKVHIEKKKLLYSSKKKKVTNSLDQFLHVHLSSFSFCNADHKVVYAVAVDNIKFMFSCLS